jgi:hypothetical protein
MKKRLYHIIFLLTILIITFILFTFFIPRANAGALNFHDVWADAGSGIAGANLQDGLDSPYCLTVSPDNNNVYVTGFGDSAVVVFDRAATGALTFREVWADAGSLVAGANLQDGLAGVEGLDVSADNNSVYVAGSGDSAAAVFDICKEQTIETQNMFISPGSYPWPGLTITDGNPATITAANDIRITIPSNLNTTWSVSGFGTITGTAAGKIDTTPANVTYADDGRTMIIDVTADFEANDDITIDDICYTEIAPGTSSGQTGSIGLSVDGDSTPEATDTCVWTVAVISLSSDANQTFYVGEEPSTLMSPVTITEDATNVTIKAGGSIDLQIPSGFNMTWDTSIGTATIGGSASGKVGTSVSYSGDYKTVYISVTTDFLTNQYITVSGLKFTNFTGVSSASNLRVQTSFFAVANDDKTIEILDPGQDADGDGILNINETNTGTYVDPTHTGTDPNNPDSDNDGYSDGEEVNWDPLKDPNDIEDIPQYSPGDYYTSWDNSFWGDGTSGNPWNLHTAIHHINGGAAGNYTLHVAQGTYSVANGEDDSLLEVLNNPVTIIGEYGSKPVLDGTGATSWDVGIETSGNNITIKNLEIRNFSKEGILISGNDTNIFYCDVHNNGTSGSAATGIQLNDTGLNSNVEIMDCAVRNNGASGNGDGIGVIWADNVIIKGCDIENNVNAGIFVKALAGKPTTDVYIKANLIEDNPTGIEIIDCSPTVMRNKIEDNNTGIFIEGSAAAASPTIWNNIIYPLDSSIANGIGVNGIASPSIYHNTIDGGSNDGLYVDTSSGTTYIKYNIIANFDQYGINVIAGNHTIDYNDVWNNATNYSAGSPTHPNDISAVPLYETDYSIPPDSPCVDAIPKAVGDAEDPRVDLDFVATKRPKDRDNANVGNEAYDMGAYEWPPHVSYEYSLPGGTGETTDYRIFTVPVHIGPDTGEELLAIMENQLGTYDPTQWRVFAWDGSNYIEINESGFASLPVEPGDAFWIISINTTPITFEGSVHGDGGVYVIDLDPGWNLFGLPWTDTSINLDNIAVSDEVNNYWITSANNTLTQKYVWDYTGSGPYSGYEQIALGSSIQPGKGYWIKVEAGSSVKLLVPPVDNDEYFTAKSYKAEVTSSKSEEEEPPPPPGGVGSDSSGVTAGAEGGCFIATAAYGSVLHPYVKILRDFRDTYLLSNDPGKTFVALYYRYSPPLAELISDNTPLKYLTRLSLLPLIGFSAFMLYAGAIFKCAFLVALLLILLSVKYVCVTRVREG